MFDLLRRLFSNSPEDAETEKKPATPSERLDEGLDESFPASDPPAVSREPTKKT